MVSDYRHSGVGNQQVSISTIIGTTRNMMVVFVLLVFLGFPGKLSRLIGGGMATIIDYLSFAVQIALIMMSSGNDVMEIKLVNIHPAYRAVYFYATYAIIDSFWVTIDRKAILITLLHLIVTIMFAIWLIEQYDTKEMLELVYYAQFIFVSLTLFCIVFFPGIAFYKLEGVRTIGGLFKTKNEFGTQLSFGILVQCILLRMRFQKKENISLLFIGILAIQFGLMLMSKNFGALLITFSFVGYIILYSKMKEKKRLPMGLLFIVISVGFLLFALTILQAMEPLLAMVGKSVTLTGRVPLWQQCIEVMISKNTMTGYGYEMFWRTPSAVKAFHAGFPENSWAATTSSSMHNTIMELWCNIGLVGISIYFLMYLVADKGIQHLDENEYLFCSSYIVMFAIRALTERQNDPGTFYMLFQFVVLCLMLKSGFNFKINSMKKARVYDANDNSNVYRNKWGVEANGISDLAAFQSRFSNFSGSMHKAPLMGHSHGQESEPEETENRLELLLQEFDDDL